ncbi:MAG: DUF2304 domain-containing protein [Roseburia sp.]
MTLKLQIVIGIFILLVIILQTRLIKKNKLELKHALIWYFVECVILVFDIFPNLLDIIAGILGIELPINMLFFIGLMFALLIIFIMSLWISRLSNKVFRLTQELGILEHKLTELTEKQED